MIAIIDYGAGNIRSIEKALEHVGAVVQVKGMAWASFLARYAALRTGRRSRTWAGTRRHRCTATYPSSPVLQLTLISISPTRIMSSHETSKGWQQSPIMAHPTAAL